MRRAMAEDTLAPRASEFLLYTAPDGGVRVSVLFKDETAWLPQKGLAELFGVTVASISRHLKNIFESAELEENSVVTVFVTTAADDKTYRTRFYSLDAIIAVGYRVNSFEAAEFALPCSLETLRPMGVQLSVDRRAARALACAVTRSGAGYVSATSHSDLVVRAGSA
jgi:hypothetical protein